VRIAQIGHGVMPIPPVGWGAVENIIWNLKQHLEALGHSVTIYNTTSIHEVVHDLNTQRYDFVNCHSEIFALHLNTHLKYPYALTSHYGGYGAFSQGRYHREPAFTYLFRDSLCAPAVVALSEQVERVYREAGYSGYVARLRNGVETESFRFAPAAGNGRAICVGKIIPRKRQAWLAAATRGKVPIDFVGPWDRSEEPHFGPNETTRYLGSWDKPTLYQRLTDYSCLVLVSEAEAAPLVVLEAIAAGLSVVISEPCAVNLSPADFVTVVAGSEGPEAVAAAILKAIDGNASKRRTIRAYAENNLGYEVLARDYVALIEQFRRRFA